MNLRKAAFRLLDFIKKDVVSAHYKQLVAFYDDNQKSDKQLSDLLQHANANVAFYAKMDSVNIADFPVVDKTLIKTSIAQFKAENFSDKELIPITTSGSTGTPFTVFHDLNKKARNYADTIYYGKLGGYEIGTKLLYLKIWAKQKMSHPLVYRAQNIKPIDVIQLSDAQIKEILNEVTNSKQKYAILGYVSALEQIIRYCNKNGISRIDGTVDGIITMSEGLSTETKQQLAALFNTTVVSRYSNLENGIIAQQLRDDNRFHVNSASYYVEILAQDSDKIMPDGELGRIVVTDLYSYGMPMIRYDTGDLGAIQRENGTVYLKSIEGRKLDVLFDTQGNVISSYIMYKNMWQYSEISQYQLIQTEKTQYIFKINCNGNFTKEEQLINEFKTYLGQDADFSVEYVNEIPLLDSGKRRKTVNLYRSSI